VPFAVPGDRIFARVFKRKKNFAEAEIVEVLEPSALRTEPRCFYFGTCGGCRWQHVDYRAQLDAKTESVRNALTHTGRFADVDVEPAIGSEKVYFYRNKMEFSFSAGRWLTREEIDSGREFDTEFALGLHVPGTFDKVLDLHECHLQSPTSRELVNGMRTLAREHGMEPWHIRRHTGFLRHLVIRTAERTGEMMVNLVTNGFDETRMNLVGDFLRREFPKVSTFVNTIHTGKAQTALGEEIRTIFGPGVIHDRIGSYTFEISPNAFFQTNTAQAEKLYEVAKEFAELQADDLVYDLYCGAGTISIYLADAVDRVVGIELIEEAVHNARANAAANDVSNCSFVEGDIAAVFAPPFLEEHGRPDVLVVDPPRAGMHPGVVEQVAALGPDRFVYVSCNPQTQARDLDMLRASYRIERVQPVDLFPHTHHVENVVKLRRTAPASI
jgi:23S rRNA (uracil1939-C5)-methyltransferase